MKYAFIIMQIGDKQLDDVYYKAIKPAIESCKLNVKRVDKHNKGGLLKSEIINFINGADIVIADITNERPNCYLEIGYVMGVDKFKNLILTVREDHFLDSPNHKNGGPKVHFDLGGYDILRWNTDEIERFQKTLTNRILRRLRIIEGPSTAQKTHWNEKWLKSQEDHAKTRLSELEHKGATEIKFTLNTQHSNWTPKELNEAAKFSQIRTFGWPIGVYFDDVEKFKPKPRADGLAAEIVTDTTYDYWAINRDGSYYTLVSFFEDERKPNSIFTDIRIIRATEALLFCARFYTKLGVDPSSTISFSLGYIGIKGRVLSSAGSMWKLKVSEHKSVEDIIKTEHSFKLQDIESNLVAFVKKFTDPLFSLFDFFEVESSKYEELVNNFVNGKI